LKEIIEHWLGGIFKENNGLHKLGEIVSKHGWADSSSDFGSESYSSQLHHLGYFLYGTAFLVNLDPY